MKKLMLIVAVVCTGSQVYSQQLQTTSFYGQQGLLINPAMAGTGETDMIAATYRSQWNGVSGSPRTATLYGSFAMPKYKAGIGGYLFNDVTGPTARRGINLELAKHIPLSNGGQFSIGIATKLMQYAIDKEKISQSLGADPVLAGNGNPIKFDAGFGVAYVGKKLQLGVSVAQLVQSKLQFYEGNLTTTEEAKLYRHYYVHGLYKWDLDGMTKIVPNFVFTYLPSAPVELQVGATAEHNDIFWYGVGFKINQSFMATAGLIFNKKIKIGYTYDAYVTKMSAFKQGVAANEFLVRYDF